MTITYNIRSTCFGKKSYLLSYENIFLLLHVFLRQTRWLHCLAYVILTVICVCVCVCVRVCVCVYVCVFFRSIYIHNSRNDENVKTKKTWCFRKSHLFIHNYNGFENTCKQTFGVCQYMLCSILRKILQKKTVAVCTEIKFLKNIFTIILDWSNPSTMWSFVISDFKGFSFFRTGWLNSIQLTHTLL